MTERISLRERKKAATRAAISDIATRLFIERGFDDVTVAEIAEAADVAKMTVFNYFPRKEDLFFDREDEGIALVRTALAGRAPGTAPLAALRARLRELARAGHPFAKFDAGTAGFWQTVQRSAALTARARELRDTFADEVAAMLAQCAGRARDDADARLAALLFAAALQAAYAEGLRLHRRSGAARAAFLAVAEKGLDGIAAALRGTPYV